MNNENSGYRITAKCRTGKKEKNICNYTSVESGVIPFEPTERSIGVIGCPFVRVTDEFVVFVACDGSGICAASCCADAVADV